MYKLLKMLVLLSGSLLAQNEILNFAILGMSGRAQFLLHECLKQNSNIRVVAICSDHLADNSWLHVDQSKHVSLSFAQAFEDTSYYPDTHDGLTRMFEVHNGEIDRILIASANHNHARHLNTVLAHSDCKNVFLEKPLCRTLQEYESFHMDVGDRQIGIGLTLRYAPMVNVINQTLQTYKHTLGKLKTVNVWERLCFAQALTAFMLGWRKDRNLSGGLLLEKSIHDLDLALYIIDTLDFKPQSITISSNADHRFFKLSEKERIVHFVLENKDTCKRLIDYDIFPFCRNVSLIRKYNNVIDWQATVDHFFEGLPADDNFEQSDMIQDHHVLHAKIQTMDGDTIDFDMEVELGGYRFEPQRGMRFGFDHGEVVIDVIKSSVTVTVEDGTTYTIDLKTKHNDHADGDRHLAAAILGEVAYDNFGATYDNATVQLATCMALASEQQVLGGLPQNVTIEKEAQWALLKQ